MAQKKIHFIFNGETTETKHLLSAFVHVVS